MYPLSHVPWCRSLVRLSLALASAAALGVAAHAQFSHAGLSPYHFGSKYSATTGGNLIQSRMYGSMTAARDGAGRRIYLAAQHSTIPFVTTGWIMQGRLDYSLTTPGEGAFRPWIHGELQAKTSGMPYFWIWLFPVGWTPMPNGAQNYQSGLRFRNSVFEGGVSIDGYSCYLRVHPTVQLEGSVWSAVTGSRTVVNGATFVKSMADLVMSLDVDTFNVTKKYLDGDLGDATTYGTVIVDDVSGDPDCQWCPGVSGDVEASFGPTKLKIGFQRESACFLWCSGSANHYYANKSQPAQVFNL